MEISNFIAAFIGGLLIGVAVTIMLLFNGRITGNSGIVGGLYTLHKDKAYWRVFYLGGLIVGALIYQGWKAGEVAIVITASYPMLIVAGLLVGYGTLTGSGCTSGHGICGIARCSKRSIMSTAVYLGTAMITVLILKFLRGIF